MVIGKILWMSQVLTSNVLVSLVVVKLEFMLFLLVLIIAVLFVDANIAFNSLNRHAIIFTHCHYFI